LPNARGGGPKKKRKWENKDTQGKKGKVPPLRVTKRGNPRERREGGKGSREEEKKKDVGYWSKKRKRGQTS